MIRLTVTGNRFQVARACADRGIPAALAREDSHGGTCCVDVSDLFGNAAQAWQAAPPFESPYPVGTCLCFHRFPDTGILGSRNGKGQA